MKQRREAKVKIEGDVSKVADAKCRIDVCEAGYDLFVEHMLVAECEYAKRLSDWAFQHGAREVRHNYDLALSDREP